jgi:hypothetical protein
MSDSLRIPLCRSRSSCVIDEAWVDSDIARWVFPWTWYACDRDKKPRPPHLWLCRAHSDYVRLDLHRYVVLVRLQVEGVYLVRSSRNRLLTPDEPLLLSRLALVLPKITLRSHDPRNCCWSNLCLPLATRLSRPPPRDWSREWDASGEWKGG